MKNLEKKYIALIVIIIILLSLNAFIRPILRKKDAIKLVEEIITFWEQGDFLRSIEYWEDINKHPTFYKVNSYKIIGASLGKEDGKNVVDVVVKLNFTHNNIYPSGENWIFKIKKLPIGWKVTKFGLAD